MWWICIAYICMERRKKKKRVTNMLVFCGLLGGDDLSCRLEAGRGGVCVSSCMQSVLVFQSQGPFSSLSFRTYLCNLASSLGRRRLLVLLLILIDHIYARSKTRVVSGNKRISSLSLDQNVVCHVYIHD